VNTYAVKASDINRDWYVVDAQGLTLGRLASEIAKVLRGKNKPIYTTHLDTGDHVIVINAEQIAVTGHKMSDKMYYRHSTYPGGFRVTDLQTLMEKHPTQAIYFAVRGMLPKNRLGRQMMGKLKIYAGNAHPHAAQKPKVLEL
jgi:large subunit ribosomal protein L13